jgi:hypothetical protein
MRGVKVVFGCAMTVGLLAVVAIPALATPSWYKCAEKTGGKFKDNKCLMESSGGEFEWVKIAKATEVVVEGELGFEDPKLPSGAVKLKCKVKGPGTVGPNAEDQIKSIEVTGCTVIKGTCGSPEVKADNTPWATELFEETGGEIRDRIKSSGVGLPGWTLICVVVKKIEDVCEGETSVGVANKLSEGLVELKFDKKSATLECSQSKAKSGLVEGTLKVKSASGVAISVK